MALNREEELEFLGISEVDQLQFPMFNSIQIQYFKDLIQLYRRDRLNLEPEEKDFVYYKLQFNSLKSMEQVIMHLIETNEHFKKNKIVNTDVPDKEEKEMMQYFRSEHNNTF